MRSSPRPRRRPGRSGHHRRSADGRPRRGGAGRSRHPRRAERAVAAPASRSRARAARLGSRCEAAPALRGRARAARPRPCREAAPVQPGHDRAARPRPRCRAGARLCGRWLRAATWTLASTPPRGGHRPDGGTGQGRYSAEEGHPTQAVRAPHPTVDLMSAISCTGRSPYTAARRATDASLKVLGALSVPRRMAGPVPCVTLTCSSRIITLAGHGNFDDRTAGGRDPAG
jgi:hypothetical protein